MPSGSKGKNRGREHRRSRSRNTTPSSALSASTLTSSGAVLGYLESDVSKLMVPSSIQYADVLDKMGGSGSGQIPDPKELATLVENLKTLSQLAEERGDACNASMRELSQKRKEVIEEQREREQVDREAEERLRMKREAEDDEEEGGTVGGGSRASKHGKLKKRKERPPKDDRPLSHGAHGVARQDGHNLKTDVSHKRGSRDSRDSGKHTSPARRSGNLASSTSSLSPTSLTSPAAKSPGEPLSGVGTPESAVSSDSHQPEPAPPVPQYQVFGPDPLTFDDPTIYHIRDVAPEMTDEEKKEIYCVAEFPKNDLSHMMAGIIPDKDFSNAKPTNQVSANTFAAYIEPYVRPLTEEDIAFLKERGDRTNPFLLPRRGKRHYTEIWAEEDGSINVEPPSQTRERLPLNQGRGSVEEITDESAQTEQVSVGPLLSRLYSLLRYEHRTLPDENPPAPATAAPAASTTANSEDTAIAVLSSTLGANVNGDSSMDLDQQNPESTETKPLPSATSFSDASANGFKIPAAKFDHNQLDERLKAELRYVGLFEPDDNPDYDAHYDDDIAERLRLLQGELKRQTIVNGARKARLLEIAGERLAYQEFNTIHEDLDAQVQQAYLKRTRTLGKSKKGGQAKHRPGGAGGGSHLVHPPSGVGVSRPGIGDVARTLMDRRKRWSECIGPVFKDSKTTVPGKGETIFDPTVMEDYEKAELERWDEEQE